MEINKDFLHEEYWETAWVRHIETYLSTPPRAGYWLASKFSNINSILELAGGSCRDSHYLSLQDINVIGSDFDTKTLKYLESCYSSESLKLQREDAFSLSLPDKTIDLTFSNGFWVLFSKNSQISALIFEQARVTKRFIISFVHNAKNRTLVEDFKEKSRTDSLYNIRFFYPEELLQIIQDSGLRYKSVRIEKFGGPIDRLLAQSFKGINNPLLPMTRNIVPNLYQYQPWSITERVACVIEL